MRRLLMSAFLLVLGAASLSGAAMAAEKYALLVGVGDYEDERIDDLRAPGNDVAGMAALSLRMGVPEDNLIILATSLDPGLVSVSIDNKPTRYEITRALKRLAENVESGDQILIHFSGHGIQLPDQTGADGEGDEKDGMDELLLPMDATGNFLGNDMQNALSDDELGGYIDAMRMRGASVWLVIDSCHAGTALRSAPPAGIYRKTRYVDPSTLGIDVPEARRISNAPLRSIDFSEGLDGDVAAFYAVGPSDQAIEGEWLMPDGTYQSRPFGLLTFGILQASATGAIRSYRDLAQVVSASYSIQDSVGTGRPQFEGDFDRPILGEGLLEPKNWLVDIDDRELKLRGGRLDFIGEGALFKLENLGRPKIDATVRATDVTSTSATLSPIDSFDLQSLIASHSTRLRATLIDAGVRLTTSIGVQADGADRTLEAVARDAVAKAIQESGGQVVRANGQAPDVLVVPGKDRIWIAAGETDPALFDPDARGPHWIACDNADCETAISRGLAKYLRAARLRRVLVSTMDGAVSAQMTIEAAFLRGRDGSCSSFSPPPASAYRGLQVSSEAAAGTAMSNCDQLWLKVKYDGEQALDVTPLYLAVDGSISLLSGDTKRDSDMRIGAGETAQFFIRIRTETNDGRPYAVGLEDVLLIAVEQSPEQPPRAYRWLATSKQQTLRDNKHFDPLADALEDAVGYRTRRGKTATASDSASRSTVLQIPLNVQPASESENDRNSTPTLGGA